MDNMVSSNTTEESDGKVENTKPTELPAGNYTLVSWDLDTTGSRLVDEICQIGAYTPTSSFSQYVMPYRDLTQAARRRHNIRIITIGRFRMLKDVKRGRVLKTKSEVSALTDFIQWLSEAKGDKDGVVLLKHENRKIMTPLLLEALGKYNLMDDFRKVVVGFADGYAFAENKCAKSVRYFTLRTLTSILLHRDDQELDHAHNRAQAIYEVATNVAGLENLDAIKDPEKGPKNLAILVDALRPFTLTVSEEENSLVNLRATVVRQDSFRPVFAAMLSRNSRERQRAFNLRNILVGAGLNYESTRLAHEKSGVEGVKTLVSEAVQAKVKDLDDLVRILMEHFAPEDYPKSVPTEKIVRNGNRRDSSGKRVRVKSESKGKKIQNGEVTVGSIGEIGAGDAPSDTTLDTTASSPCKLVTSSTQSGDSSPPPLENEVASADSSTH
ncbi:maternal protein exuperantia-like isoform X2 [Ischnura elegans]|uniref:maternal protein exuperantia-like isoform X2 n=1 Tax=Ischnura elegans TaxID=197161 RepID=UPI001ED8B2A0|nr:maternal protein exuperantia-like isoform X2 [Ischnura elegans]